MPMKSLFSGTYINIIAKLRRIGENNAARRIVTHLLVLQASLAPVYEHQET
jgi:hypothetical protein